MNQNEDYNKLCDLRSQIEKLVNDIGQILEQSFPDEYNTAYQHWIPQILTSLRDNTKWLPRGNYSMEYTIAKIADKLQEKTANKGVSKYIK